MIEFRNVSKDYRTPNSRKVIVDGLSLTLAAGSKVGRARPQRRRQVDAARHDRRHRAARRRLDPPRRARSPGRSGSAAASTTELTGAQNMRFVARIYGVDTEALIAYVADFAELGDFMDMPVRTYSSGMKARLGFGMSMGIAFDWYLVDELTAVGDSRFKKKSLALYRARLQDAGLLMVSHSINTIRTYCTSGLVLDGGRATYYPDIAEAVAAHERNMAAA